MKTRAWIMALVLPVLAIRAEAAEPRPLKLRATAAAGAQWVTGSGYDPYSSNDALPRLQLSADTTVWSRRSLALAVGAAWELGLSSSEARGFESQLTLHRFLVPVEARWHLTPRFYPFVRLAPGLVVQHSSVTGLSRNLDDSDGRMSGSRAVLAADLSVGTAFALSPRRDTGQRQVSIWLVPELGYGLAGKAVPRLRPSDIDSLGSAQPTVLPPFGASGPFFRLGVSVAY